MVHGFKYVIIRAGLGTEVPETSSLLWEKYRLNKSVSKSISKQYKFHVSINVSRWSGYKSVLEKDDLFTWARKQLP